MEELANDLLTFAAGLPWRDMAVSGGWVTTAGLLGLRAWRWLRAPAPPPPPPPPPEPVGEEVQRVVSLLRHLAWTVAEDGWLDCPEMELRAARCGMVRVAGQDMELNRTEKDTVASHAEAQHRRIKIQKNLVQQAARRKALGLDAPASVPCHHRPVDGPSPHRSEHED